MNLIAKRGGPRPGAGRPLGSQNRPASLRDRAFQHADAALALLATTVSDKAAPLEHRMKAAEILLVHSAVAAGTREPSFDAGVTGKAMKMTEAMFKDV